MLLLSHLKNPTDFLHSVCMHAKLLHSCLIFSDTMDCSLPGSSFHLILQAGILECLLQINHKYANISQCERNMRKIN